MFLLINWIFLEKKNMLFIEFQSGQNVFSRNFKPFPIGILTIFR